MYSESQTTFYGFPKEHFVFNVYLQIKSKKYNNKATFINLLIIIPLLNVHLILESFTFNISETVLEPKETLERSSLILTCSFYVATIQVS